MGQVSSHKDNDNKDIKKEIIPINTDDSNNTKQNTSSDKDINVSRTNYLIQNSECSTSINPKETEVKIKTMFEWKEGGNIVYITGSFSNWTELFIMNKTDSNIHELTIVIITNSGFTKRNSSV